MYSTISIYPVSVPSVFPSRVPPSSRPCSWSSVAATRGRPRPSPRVPSCPSARVLIPAGYGPCLRLEEPSMMPEEKLYLSESAEDSSDWITYHDRMQWVMKTRGLAFRQWARASWLVDVTTPKKDLCDRLGEEFEGK